MELPVLVSSHSSYNQMPEVTTGQVSFDNELGQIQYLYGSVMYSAYMIRSTVVVRLTIAVIVCFAEKNPQFYRNKPCSCTIKVN